MLKLYVSFCGSCSKAFLKYVRALSKSKLSNFSRNFSNKAGGTLAGMEEKLPELKKAGYKKVISLPTTGSDTISSHKYWPTRPFQTENMDSWNSYITSCFKNGITYVTDEALTSQGLEGVNFQYALKWMNAEDKPHEFYMFRMKGLEDAALGLGEVPANYENLRHKVVNGINNYTVQPNGQIKIEANPDYDASLPTYINIYDDSLVSDEQRNDKKNLIREYAKTNPTHKNPDGSEDVNTLAINLHDDTLIPYAHPIDPYEYDANIKNLNIIKEKVNVFEKAKPSFIWAKEFIKIGSISGLESLVRNVAYMVMISRMVNVVGEQGTYWVANNFIWGWLLLPVLQLGELIKQETSTDKDNIRKNSLGYFGLTAIISALWFLSIPLWKPFMVNVLQFTDVDKLFELVLVLVGFYVLYAFQNVFDSIFYGLGKTNYMLFESVVTNTIYYGIAFVLYLTGVWTPSLIGIALLFGIGNAFDSVVSLGAFAYLLKKEKINILRR